MKKKLIFGLAMIGASVAVLGGCGGLGGSTIESETATTINSETVNTEATTADNVNSSVNGDKVASFSYINTNTSGKPEELWELTINNATETDSLPAFEKKYEYTDAEGEKETTISTVYTPEEGKKIILLDLNMKNKGKRQQSFCTIDFDYELILKYDNYYEFPVYSGGINYNDKGEVEVTTVYFADGAKTELFGMPQSGISVDVLSEGNIKALFEVPNEVVNNKDKPLSFQILDKQNNKKVLLDISLR